ncbi:unnamed protein product [Mytilus edulis]|uniref:Uncharacterized protein n=1 Tax=Mytilus edulis TaxID=6550 RepID=A0A8S3TMK8_MYTED|nr:unnamed protein product [Mytilus edulis]
MSRNREDSLRFYEYLCQKIGSEEDVKARRITSIVCDIGNVCFNQFRSGSNGEGLHLKGSDVDIMIINCQIVVETLKFDQNCPSEINQSLRRNARLVNEIRTNFSCGMYAAEENKHLLLSTLLHYSRSRMSEDILLFSVTCTSDCTTTFTHSSWFKQTKNISSIKVLSVIYL